jgi:cadmium resistance protein CadD (predicted permease)
MMSIGLGGQAVGLFAVTNIDDIVILALFFGRGTGRVGASRVVVGQCLGFAAILAVAVAGALGAGLLPETVIPYLGFLPLALGLRAAWSAWSEHRSRRGAAGRATDEEQARGQAQTGPGVFTVAAVSAANGGDNIGVYLPVFAATGAGGLLTYVVVFLVLVLVWCAAGSFLASRPVAARALSRWGHILFPLVLVAIGSVILVEGHAFGL